MGDHDGLESVITIGWNTHAKELGADNCHNIDRLLRVPGTINWPNAKKRADGRVPVMSRLVHDGGQVAIYTPNQLARVFPPIAGADKETNTSPEVVVGEIELLTADDLGLSPLNPLRSVIDYPTGDDRSKDGIRAASDLLRAGFTKLQVLGVLLNPKNKVSAHYLDQADPRRAALRVIQWLEDHKDESKGQGADFDNAGAEQAPKLPRFLFETVSDLRSMPPAEYLVDGWIPERSVGLLYGRWGSGKTFVGFDLALHLAFGLPDWHGAKLPGEACDVLIIAREGHAGFIKRVDAFMQHHDLTEETKRIVFMRSPISFLDDAGFAQLKEAIKALGRPFRFVLVDTVGRVLPGADMAKEQPITLFMERLQQLGELTGGTTLGVHHENKSGDANGSMYFQNNSDFMFQASREGEGPLERGKLTCAKQKEGDDQWSREVTFAKVELPDGKSSLVVEDVFEEKREPNSAAVKKSRPLKSEHKLVLDALDAALIDHGKRIPVADAPIGTVVVHKDDWMSELFRRGLLDKTDKNRWRDFGRVWKALAARSLIATRDDMFWRASHR
jgi:hypothetical protein